jgi:hypothetical protein
VHAVEPVITRRGPLRRIDTRAGRKPFPTGNLGSAAVVLRPGVADRSADSIVRAVVAERSSVNR